MTLMLSYMFFLIFILVLGMSSAIMGTFFKYSLMISGFSLEFSMVLDEMSISSIMLVLLISSCVFCFSHVYMSGEVHSDRFILLLGGFVFSMLILLVSSSIPLLLVGWDGLGVTSFLLIVYYDSKSNNRSGMITFGVNRMGDAILISTCIFFLESGCMCMSGNHLSWCLVISYVLISMTKSAQYPFSMWLPLAMDAPTPVSALVHSSTLVTAGFFLMARIIPESYNPYLLLIGSTTLCIGGFCAVFSTDLKKLIANSTLSNLGLMAFILSLSNKSLMVLHLFTHALFKAGLFICAGLMLMMSFGAQDSRMLYGTGKNSPILGSFLSSFFISSVGMFFVSTFFSKHEICLMAQMMSVNVLCLVMMGLGVMFTTLYSLRFCYVILGSKMKGSTSSSTPWMVFVPVGVLAFCSIWYGNFASYSLLSPLVCYEMPINMIALCSVAVWCTWCTSLSSNMAKSMLQMDSMMDFVSMKGSMMQKLHCTDMGYGSFEHLNVSQKVGQLSSMMVGVMAPNRVNMSFLCLGLCTALLFM